MKVFDVWKIVFGKMKYLFLALLVAVLFYLLNVLIADYLIIFGLYDSLGFLGTLKLFFNLALGFGRVIATHSFISLVVVSVLLGMFVSIISYKVRIQAKKDASRKTGVFGSIGVFLAVLAPGCAACGVGLLALFGLGGILITFLPFDGLELSILAIIIMIFVLWKVSKDLLECNSCQNYISKHEKKKNERRIC
jgi:hypothetical protein